MATNLYVGNLAWSVTDDELLDLFAEHGPVRKAQIVKDRDTGRSRGFGFVEMESPEDAQRAIDALHGLPHHQRPLTVNHAREREPRARQY